jgi:hypothetical protein
MPCHGKKAMKREKEMGKEKRRKTMRPSEWVDGRNFMV